MSDKEIMQFINKINKLDLSIYNKKRMVRLFQVRGSNKVNKTMTFVSFALLLKKSKAKIVHLKLGPKWNRLVFVDIDKEV